jgi:ethanolamine-phosphate phospho-lyase
LPYESHAERWETVDLLARSGIGRFRTTLFFPFPGTESARMAVEGGYHGNTTTLVELSPYKHDGKGGDGPPSWLYRLPCPDTYRGYRAGEPQAAELFARAHRDGNEIAGVICEPLIGCGGQIVPPDGWLRCVFAAAREAGAICIADEVQIGFGRIGTHWWGFERDGAVPDIVTLGKPMGNGHPLAAVVTTREIADAFDNGMEYFSTFGGNPVSCAIGMAVLDVIEEERLRENATRVGARLLDGFRQLATKHELIGDVRGVGLYVGVELVKDRATREPAPDELAAVIERCKADGVLLASDGPHRNVLKIKPPLPFSELDAELALSVIDRSLLLEPA